MLSNNRHFMEAPPHPPNTLILHSHGLPRFRSRYTLSVLSSWMCKKVLASVRQVYSIFNTSVRLVFLHLTKLPPSHPPRGNPSFFFRLLSSRVATADHPSPCRKSGLWATYLIWHRFLRRMPFLTQHSGLSGLGTATECAPAGVIIPGVGFWCPACAAQTHNPGIKSLMLYPLS